MKKSLIFTPITFIMKEPEIGSERVDEGLCGMEVEIINIVSDEWVEIKTKYHYTGYIHIKNLIQNDNILKAWETLEKRVVLKNTADVLMDSKIQSSLILNIPKGGVVGFISKTGDGWVKVFLSDGSIGYMRESHLAEKLKNITIKNENYLRKNLVKIAYSYMGTGYRWGGKTPMGIDCSGLCFMAYYLNGIIIYRDAAIKEGFPIKKISFSLIKEGDLIFFPGHVAMYIGNQKYIHSTLKVGSDGVVINSLNPNDRDFRRDLSEKIIAAGSIFGG